LVSKIIYESPLREKLLFKGGTALHHTYLPQMRFSEGPDFTATSTITLEEIKPMIAAQGFLEVKESFVSDFTIKINHPKYSGPPGSPNSLKVEINPSGDSPALPGRLQKLDIF
jgi:hypothetical protein